MRHDTGNNRTTTKLMAYVTDYPALKTQHKTFSLFYSYLKSYQIQKCSE